MIKGIFKRLIKYRILAGFIFIILLSLIILTILTIIGIIFQITILKDISSMMAAPVTLFSSFIALMIPFILITVQNDSKREKEKEIRVKCYNAIYRICDFSIKQYDSKTNSPKDNIEEEMRMKIIEPIEILNLYKDKSLDMGIVLSSGWEKAINQHLHIFIFVGNALEIQLISPSYGKVIHAKMMYNGKVVDNKNTIDAVLNDLKNKINNL
ncbi:MAG: hypothetical protein ACFFCI_03430 [Promethearchaeota archaeon]